MRRRNGLTRSRDSIQRPGLLWLGTNEARWWFSKWGVSSLTDATFLGVTPRRDLRGLGE